MNLKLKRRTGYKNRQMKKIGKKKVWYLNSHSLVFFGNIPKINSVNKLLNDHVQ